MDLDDLPDFDFTAKLATTIDSPWLALEPIPLGDVPAGAGTPFAYVLVTKRERPFLRLDVHPGEGCFLREQAIIWARMVAVGLGTRAFLVDLRTRSASALVVDGYFSGFWSSDEMLLVIDATGITRVEKGGVVKWSRRDLGVDGVEVREVKGKLIFGRGCFDPPEDWRSFVLSADTGRLVIGED